MADDESSDQKAKVNSLELPKRISIYTVLVAFICIFIIGYVIADGRYFKLINKTGDQNTITKPEEYGHHRLGIYLLVIFSGAFGGCLYNFRGIKKHLEEENFESKFAISYYLRPLSAGMCGVFVFVLVLSGVLILSPGNTDIHSKDAQTIMLFVAISMLAGYGSHEFLKKVKDIMNTVFTLSEHEKNKNLDEKSSVRDKGESKP
jgi:hypothetical protein